MRNISVRVMGRAIAAAALSCLMVMVSAVQAQPAVAASAAATAGAAYKLGAGDLVRVTVYQNPDLSVEARITEGGTMSFPLLGAVRLGGLTVAAAEKRIADGLRDGNFVRQPQVSILVVQVRGNQASVLGQVNRPGQFPLEAAEVRLTDLIALAGGVAPTGADTVVVVGTRNGKPFRTEVNLPTVFSQDRSPEDLVIQDGDTVWVDRAPIVYIYGEVQRPGAVRLERGMTVMQGLAAGGGLTLRGTERGMRVHRRGPDGKVQVIQPGMEEALKDGDVIYVRESLF